MKAFFPIFFLILSPILALAAGETLVRMDDPSLPLDHALGKQIKVRFSDKFVEGRLPKADFDGLVLSELQEGMVCLFGQPQGIAPEAKALEGYGRVQQGDICLPRTEVSVKLPAGGGGLSAAPFYSTDLASCAWSWKSGGGIGLWTEDCKFDSGHWNVTYDAANDWFMLRVDNGEPYPVLRQFHVAAGAGLEALLPELKSKGLVLDDAECQFAETTEKMAPDGWTSWEVVPTGKLREKFAALPQDEVPEPPCGQLGMAVDSIGFFMVKDGQPGRVLHVNLGQDGTMIDLPSITLD